jgi:hypothetical protein
LSDDDWRLAATELKRAQKLEIHVSQVFISGDHPEELGITPSDDVRHRRKRWPNQ